MSEDQYAESVAIVYPYVFPQDTNLPIDYDIYAHSTLMYLGETDELTASREDIQTVMNKVGVQDVGIVDVKGLELFGKDGNILVMRLDSSVLEVNFTKMLAGLSIIGVDNASEWPYNPHITLNEDYYGPTVGFTLPTTVGLGAPVLWWGDDRS